MALRHLIAVFMGLMWAWLAGNAMAESEGATNEPPSEQVVTARTSDELLQALQPWVAEHLHAQLGPVEVESLGGWRRPAKAAKMPHAAKAVEAAEANRWRVSWQPAVARQGDWLVSLRAVPEQADGPVVDVRFVARERQAVWRVGMPLQKGDAIDCASLHQDGRVQRSGPAVWQGRCDALSGLVARRPIGVGEVLMQSDVGPRPAVLREQAVHVLSRSQGIVIEARGLALADASVGQRVPVRIAGQDRVLQAIVMAPGELQIMEGME